MLSRQSNLIFFILTRFGRVVASFRCLHTVPGFKGSYTRSWKGCGQLSLSTHRSGFKGSYTRSWKGSGQCLLMANCSGCQGPFDHWGSTKDRVLTDLCLIEVSSYLFIR
jgi:hypothetical protein